jgi:hypothetical protein
MIFAIINKNYWDKYLVDAKAIINNGVSIKIAELLEAILEYSLVS